MKNKKRFFEETPSNTGAASIVSIGEKDMCEKKRDVFSVKIEGEDKEAKLCVDLGEGEYIFAGIQVLLLSVSMVMDKEDFRSALNDALFGEKDIESFLEKFYQEVGQFNFKPGKGCEVYFTGELKEKNQDNE